MDEGQATRRRSMSEGRVTDYDSHRSKRFDAPVRFLTVRRCPHEACLSVCRATRRLPVLEVGVRPRALAGRAAG